MPSLWDDHVHQIHVMACIKMTATNGQHFRRQYWMVLIIPIKNFLWAIYRPHMASFWGHTKLLERHHRPHMGAHHEWNDPNSSRKDIVKGREKRNQWRNVRWPGFTMHSILIVIMLIIKRVSPRFSTSEGYTVWCAHGLGPIPCTTQTRPTLRLIWTLGFSIRTKLFGFNIWGGLGLSYKKREAWLRLTWISSACCLGADLP